MPSDLHAVLQFPKQDILVAYLARILLALRARPVGYVDHRGDAIILGPVLVLDETGEGLDHDRLRLLDPEGAALLAELTFEALKDDGLDYVGGLEMGAVPLAGAIAQLSWIKGHPIAAFFVRKKPKEHGARLAVEGLAKGESLQGKRVVIVEDVTTTGESALKAVEAVRDAGGEVALVLTMVDREEGATETFAAANLPFRSLYKAGEFLKD